MSRLLFIATDYKPRPGGIADYIDNLARGLIAGGNTAKVLAMVEPHKKERLAFLQGYEEWVIPFRITYDERPTGMVANKMLSMLEIMRCISSTARHALEKTPLFRASVDAIARFQRIIAEEKPDVVVFGHVDLRLYPFALLLKEQRRPYAVIAHDFEVYRSTERKNDLVRRGSIIRNARWVIANSRHTKRLVEMWGIPSARIGIVHPPVSEAAIKIGREVGERHEEDGILKMITICRLVRCKGVDILLRALSILDGRDVPYKCIICGDGPERSSLERLANELQLGSRTSFAGYITDDTKWQLLRNSDLYVMPSRVDPKEQHEGFGIAFIEAAAFGLASVGSNDGGIPDAIVHGRTGVLVPRESPEALADVLTFLYRNPDKRREMGKLGRERAGREFSPMAIAARLQEVISECHLTKTSEVSIKLEAIHDMTTP